MPSSLSPLTSPLSISSKIESALTDLVYKQATFGIMISFFCASIVFLGLYETANHTALIIWFGYMLCVTLARAILCKFYQHRSLKRYPLIFWKRWFVAGAFLGGLTWGIAGSFFFFHEQSVEQTLILFVIAGIISGAIPNLAGVRAAALAFLLPALLPLIISLALLNQGTYLLFLITVVTYLVYMLVLTGRIHKTIRSSVSLRFENDELLMSLSRTQSKLEFLNQQLQDAATHDPLTQAANRNLFIENFAKAIIKADEENTLLGLLYLDLDQFKTVNDYHGHQAGDQLLIAVASRLENICRKSDCIARLGGDEFAILIEDVVSKQEIEGVALKVCRALALPINIRGIDVTITASIGISIYPNDSLEMEGLLGIADCAMYYVKSLGGNNYHFNLDLLNEGSKV